MMDPTSNPLSFDHTAREGVAADAAPPTTLVAHETHRGRMLLGVLVTVLGGILVAYGERTDALSIAALGAMLFVAGIGAQSYARGRLRSELFARARRDGKSPDAAREEAEMSVELAER